jgi:hypothetical protein
MPGGGGWDALHKSTSRLLQRSPTLAQSLSKGHVTLDLKKQRAGHQLVSGAFSTPLGIFGRLLDKTNVELR